MGHGKLKKFAENETFRCLLQPAAEDVLVKGSRELVLNDHPIKGNWGREMFGNSNPIVLELGCGGGEYTIALAQRHPEINYIGVDIKGARLWKGAKYATENALPNVAFLRTRIEFITAFFGPSEVSEIWLTFSDPQLSGSQNSRLSSPMFLDRYRSFLKPGGIVHLKTDSRFLYEYTMAVVKANGLGVIAFGTNVYGEGIHFCEPSLRDPSHLRWAPPVPGEVDPPYNPPSGISALRGAAEGGHRFTEVNTFASEVIGVQTFYEKMFLQMGLPITYLAFVIDHQGDYVYPEFDADYWRSAEGPRRSFSHQPASKH
ncbi:MAG: tRNA (guanosine(46)-N7)-methyltransferase TrmB [Bacteroidales bacterium]|nr:tRNA (guanosine(46)-N7)-methyltransferase TrmB [Bacteroidales bacterium]